MGISLSVISRRSGHAILKTTQVYLSSETTAKFLFHPLPLKSVKYPFLPPRNLKDMF